MTKVDDVLARVIYGPAFNHGFATYELPVRLDARRFWTHLYTSAAPIQLSEDELEAMGKRSEEKMGAAMGQLMERWETQWFPEIQHLLSVWEQFDLRAASLSELLVHFDVTLQQMERIWSLHFEIIPPSQLPVS
ncbi:MAG: hypothetical protein ACRD1H_03085, partial [Vicinamibacterales bacterium]